MREGSHPGLSLPAKGAGGAPLVLLHGFLGTPHAWQGVLAALSNHGPVWCPWLPGHGPAAAAPATWAAAVQQLAAALPAGAPAPPGVAGTAAGGNVSAVARAMAKPRSQIQRWMRSSSKAKELLEPEAGEFII